MRILDLLGCNLHFGSSLLIRISLVQDMHKAHFPEIYKYKKLPVRNIAKKFSGRQWESSPYIVLCVYHLISFLVVGLISSND
jgi:hypothetical protein